MKEVEEILDRHRYGLTSGEIAKKARMSEKSASVFLEKLVEQKKAKKTKSGATYFYRSAKYALIVLVFMIAAAHAQDINSTNFKAFPVMASAGGDSQGVTLKISGKLGQPVSGSVTSVSFSLCSGFLCNVLEIITNAKVTFLLEFSISGSGNDTAFAGNETALKQYSSSQLTNYYACVHDVNLTNSPAFGIIFSGSVLNYLNISANTTVNNSFSLRVSQDVPGNEFILPITQDNCTIVNTRLSEISSLGSILHPFVALDEAINAVELVLGYANIDIAGSFDRTGAFTLVLEKNASNENQIIIKPA